MSSTILSYLFRLLSASVFSLACSSDLTVLTTGAERPSSATVSIAIFRPRNETTLKSAQGRILGPKVGATLAKAYQLTMNSTDRDLLQNLWCMTESEVSCLV